MGVVTARISEASELPLTIWVATFNHQQTIHVLSRPGRYTQEGQRSPAVGSANNSSDRGRIKRRPPEVRLIEVPVSHAFGISNRRLGHDGESNQFSTIYDAVLALLTDLLGSKSQDIDIDDRASTLIGELSNYLEITGIRLTRNVLLFPLKALSSYSSRLSFYKV